MEDTALSKLVEKMVLTAPQIGVSVLIFSAFWLGAVVLDRIIQGLSKKSQHPPEVLILVARIAKISVLVFGAITAVGTMGIDVSALVAGLGLTGFALGFALKDIISNVLAGFLILAYRPFRRGDQIGVAGLEGVVTEIDLRYTTLETQDKKILIPNSTLFTNPITVVSAKTKLREIKRQWNNPP